MSAALERLSPDRFDDIVAVMCDAFRDYPVMRFIVGEVHGDYDNRLRQLVAYFVYRRVALNAPVFGMVDRGSVVAAATMTPPAEPEMPAGVIARRDAAWAALGDEARLRYEAYAAATKPFTIASPHHHLNMIGVRHSHMGQGLARPLLDAAAAQSDDDPGSSGVSLTTELPRNLTLYQYFGYEIVGHARISSDLETWGLFRPRGLSR